MKKLKINKRLELRKSTITKLNENQINSIKGGSSTVATLTFTTSVTTITVSNEKTVLCQTR